MRTYSTSVICSRPCISAPCMHVHFISLLMCSSHPSRKLCERKFNRRCLRRPMKLSQPRGGNRTRAPDRAIEQYCATADSSDDFVLRSGESIPLQVRNVLRAARSEWVVMQRTHTPPAELYEHVASDQSSELMKCIQKIITMECNHKESMEERAGLQPSPLCRLKILFTRALTAKGHEDLVFTKELREITLATIHASMSSDMEDRLKHCFHCDIELVKRSRCSLCKFAGYCSESCQRKDWQNHREVCERIRKAKRKPAANEFFRALATMRKDLRPFVIPLNEDFHIRLGIFTKYYVRGEWAYDIRTIFKTSKDIVMVAYPKVKVPPNSFFWEPFEFGAVEITAVSNEKARVGKVLEAKLKQETFNQLECCQCGGPPHLLNSNRECRHLFCTKCVSSCHLRGKCKRCGCKIGTLILLGEEEATNLESDPG